MSFKQETLKAEIGDSSNVQRGQYASRIATRFGWAYDTDLGLHGLQLQCENINFSEKSFVQDNYGSALSPLSSNIQELLESLLPLQKLTP